MNITVVMPHGALGPSTQDTALDALMQRIAELHSDVPGEWASKYVERDCMSKAVQP